MFKYSACIMTILLWMLSPDLASADGDRPASGSNQQIQNTPSGKDIPPWLNDQGDRRKGPKRSGGPDVNPRQSGSHLDYWMGQMKTQNPEEFKRLKQLQEDDPKAFRQELHKRLKKRRQKSGRPFGGGPAKSEALTALEKENRGLIKKIKNAPEEEKGALMETLKTGLTKAFDERESIRSRQLNHMESELAKHRSMAKQRMEKRAQIIQGELDRLTKAKSKPDQKRPPQ